MNPRTAQRKAVVRQHALMLVGGTSLFNGVLRWIKAVDLRDGEPVAVTDTSLPPWEDDALYLRTGERVWPPDDEPDPMDDFQ